MLDNERMYSIEYVSILRIVRIVRMGAMSIRDFSGCGRRKERAYYDIA